MPATFVLAYTSALALERITAESRKQFVRLQATDAQTTEETLDIELGVLQAELQTSGIVQALKTEGLEEKLVEDPNRGDEGVTNKPHSKRNSNQAIITNADIA